MPDWVLTVATGVAVVLGVIALTVAAVGGADA